MYIIYVTIYAITAPLRLLNDVSLENDMSLAITTTSEYLSALNVLLPIGTLLYIFTIFIAYELAYFSYKVIMWLVRKIPAIS